MKMKKIPAILSTVALSFSILSTPVNAAESNKENSNKPVEHISEKQLEAYNKKLDALANAYDKGGMKQVEAMHKALGHTKVKSVTFTESAFDQTDIEWNLSVYHDQNYNYYWDGNWEFVGGGAWESDAEKVRDVVGLSITDASSPFGSLDGWSLADHSLQRIIIKDEDFDTHDAATNFHSYDAYGVKWSYQDEETWTDTVGEQGFMTVQLTNRQDSFEDFNLNASYVHNYHDTQVSLKSISWGVSGGTPTINTTYETTTSVEEWQDPYYETFSGYPYQP